MPKIIEITKDNMDDLIEEYEMNGIFAEFMQMADGLYLINTDDCQPGFLLANDVHIKQYYLPTGETYDDGYFEAKSVFGEVPFLAED